MHIFDIYNVGYSKAPSRSVKGHTVVINTLIGQIGISPGSNMSIGARGCLKYTPTVTKLILLLIGLPGCGKLNRRLLQLPVVNSNNTLIN